MSIPAYPSRRPPIPANTALSQRIYPQSNAVNRGCAAPCHIWPDCRQCTRSHAGFRSSTQRGVSWRSLTKLGEPPGNVTAPAGCWIGGHAQRELSLRSNQPAGTRDEAAGVKYRGVRMLRRPVVSPGSCGRGMAAYPGLTTEAVGERVAYCHINPVSIRPRRSGGRLTAFDISPVCGTRRAPHGWKNGPMISTSAGRRN